MPARGRVNIIYRPWYKISIDIFKAILLCVIWNVGLLLFDYVFDVYAIIYDYHIEVIPSVVIGILGPSCYILLSMHIEWCKDMKNKLKMPDEDRSPGARMFPTEESEDNAKQTIDDIEDSSKFIRWHIKMIFHKNKFCSWPYRFFIGGFQLAPVICNIELLYQKVVFAKNLPKDEDTQIEQNVIITLKKKWIKSISYHATDLVYMECFTECIPQTILKIYLAFGLLTTNYNSNLFVYIMDNKISVAFLLTAFGRIAFCFFRSSSPRNSMEDFHPMALRIVPVIFALSRVLLFGLSSSIELPTVCFTLSAHIFWELKKQYNLRNRAMNELRAGEPPPESLGMTIGKALTRVFGILPSETLTHDQMSIYTLYAIEKFYLVRIIYICASEMCTTMANLLITHIIVITTVVLGLIGFLVLLTVNLYPIRRSLPS